MDASGSGWCHISQSILSSSSPSHVCLSLCLRCSPPCSEPLIYTLLFTSSQCQRAARFLERFSPTSCVSVLFFYFFHPLTLHFLPQPLHFTLTHSYSGISIIFFFCLFVSVGFFSSCVFFLTCSSAFCSVGFLCNQCFLSVCLNTTNLLALYTSFVFVSLLVCLNS